MKKESMMVGIIGLLIGVVVTGFAAGQAINADNAGMMRMMGIEPSKTIQQSKIDHNSMSMADMSKQLESLNGDKFDKAFIEMMIAHHEGAVDMAELIPSRTKHDEIKRLGEAIISAQNKEIADMKQWQKDWGYSVNEMTDMMHGSH